MVNHKKLFARSFVMAAILFVAGLLLGLGIDFARTNTIVSDFRESEINTESYLIEQSFLDFFGGDKCIMAEERINHLSRELGKLGQNLINYESKNIVKQKDYDYYLRKYFLASIKAYTEIMQLKKECNIKEDVILFFFESDKQQSINQGKLLDVLVEQNDHLSVFAINVNYKDEPVIETVKAMYKIQETPTIVINGNVKKGFTSKEEILNSLTK